MKFIILLILLLTKSIYSITPGKWSYLDRFTLGNEKFGPFTETVMGKTGQKIYLATYEYNAEGKLIKENFQNGKGEYDGEVVYTYEEGKLKSEQLIAADKSLQAKKLFHYAPNGSLKEIVVFLGNGKTLLRHRIIAAIDGFVTECETKWEEEGSSEFYSTKKDISDELILIQEILDEKKKSLGQIRYFYDKKGRLEKRENVQGSSKRMQVLIYNETGQLISFSFHVKQDENWVILKTHYFSYK